MLTPAQRRGAGGMFVLMLIGVLLETLGVGLVIPALALMTQSDLTIRYPWLSPYLARAGNPSHGQLVVAGMLALVGVTGLRAVYLTWLAWWQSRFVYGIQIEVSQRLFAGYLRQPYAFHLQRNSAHLIRNTINQADEITNVFLQGLNLSTEVSVLVSIAILLVVVEPFGALLVMGILGAAGWAFSQLTRSHTARWGAARQVHERLRLQYLQQGLGGAKDVKLLGRESEFLARYLHQSRGSADVARRQATLTALPRLCLELLAVTGLAGVVVAMLQRGKPMDAVLPTLGVFAAAAFRLMPSVNRALGAIQSIRFSWPAIDNIAGELAIVGGAGEPRRGPLLPFQRALSLRHVTFRYESADRDAVRGISLSIPSGASVGFIGGSGAGKSTLVDLILGLFAPTSGVVEVDGVDIQANVRGWQDQIGYVSQAIYLTDDTLRRNVAFGLPDASIDEPALARAIRAARLDALVSELPHGLETVVGERGVRLSGGQRQRIGIARALYHDPSVLVLDEATSSLDLDTEREVMDAVRALRGDKTLLIVAHRLSTVEDCDRLFRLEDGCVVEEGGAAAVLRHRHGAGALPHNLNDVK